MLQTLTLYHIDIVILEKLVLVWSVLLLDTDKNEISSNAKSTLIHIYRLWLEVAGLPKNEIGN